jgi:hypothetical protein
MPRLRADRIDVERQAQKETDPTSTLFAPAEGHGVGMCNQDSSGAVEHGNDEWSQYDGVCWGLAKPPILGEVSSEERPGPVSKRLLLSTAARQPAPVQKPKRLPRFWTPADGIAVMVPRSPMPVPPSEQAAFASFGGDDFTPGSEAQKAQSNARKKAADKARSRAAFAFKAARKALTPGQKCPDCGVELCDWGLFDLRPVFAARDGQSVLVCRKCNGGKDVSPEAQELWCCGRKGGRPRLRPIASALGHETPKPTRPLPSTSSYLPSPEAIAAECEAIQSAWTADEAVRRREGAVN